MGASIDPSAAAPVQPMREDVMLDDVGASLAEVEARTKADQAAAEAAARAKLEAEARAAIPDDPRVRALEEALRISEEGRRRQLEQFQAAAPRAAPTEPAPAELTTEQLNELYQKDPLAAIDHMLAKREKALQDNLSKRLEPLMSGGVASSREMAKAKYPDEFALFATEIAEMEVRYKSGLNNVGAWDDLIAFIRGKSENFNKLVDHRNAKDKERATKEAQEKERASAGAHARSTIRAAAPESDAELDPIEREIARTIMVGAKDDNEAFREYKKWRGVAR